MRLASVSGPLGVRMVEGTPPLAERTDVGAVLVRFQANEVARTCTWIFVLHLSVLFIVLGAVSYPMLDPISIAIAIGTWLMGVCFFLAPSVTLHDNAVEVVNPFHRRVVSRHDGLTFSGSSFLGIAWTRPVRTFTAIAVGGSNFLAATGKDTRVTAVAAALTSANIERPSEPTCLPLRARCSALWALDRHGRHRGRGHRRRDLVAAVHRTRRLSPPSAGSRRCAWCSPVSSKRVLR
ncbi:hypothetical protein ACPPVS_16540 [Cellulomonas sp. McL0617]|uniref:hypothetical protein n=1 Tax=Cellulomonas sp. McL0617 TaxID=3415675 RepID=UPI003CE946B5